MEVKLVFHGREGQKATSPLDRTHFHVYRQAFFHIACELLQFSAQSCLTLCDPMDCSPPGSSVHEISQAKILEWVAFSFSRGSSQPRERTYVSCIGRRILKPLSHQGSPSYYRVVK